VQTLIYPVTIVPLSSDDGGGYAALVPDLPGCMSDGETPEEALANVQGAIAAWLEAAIEDGWARPRASSVDEFASSDRGGIVK
jgi:predicted RNase H-like HicB family nuclease